MHTKAHVDTITGLEEPRYGPEVTTKGLTGRRFTLEIGKEVKDQRRITGEITNLSPRGFIHTDSVTIGRLASGGQTPLSGGDDDDGEDESEGTNEHDSGETRPRNGRARGGRGQFGYGDGLGNVPEVFGEGTTG